MPIETGNLIKDLNPLWPLNAPDTPNEWPEHIRLLKTVLKNQFPGITGNGLNAIITAYEDELNYLIGVSSNLQVQLDAAQLNMIPIGAVIMYSGLFSNIPTNWALADGNNGTVNMSNRFIFGATNLGDEGNLGGFDNTVLGTHDHDYDHNHNNEQTNSKGLHSHGITKANNSGTIVNTVAGILYSGQQLFTLISTLAGAHNHTSTIGTTNITLDNAGAALDIGSNNPPYLKLAHIQRIT